MGKIRIKVLSARYWRGSGTKSERIYITTRPRIPLYYDIKNSEWRCEPEDVDIEAAEKDILALYKAASADELCNKVKGGAKPLR